MQRKPIIARPLETKHEVEYDPRLGCPSSRLLLCYSGENPAGISPTVGGREVSDPDIPCIEHAAWLNQEQLDLVLGLGFVLHPLWNDEHLARTDVHRAIAKIDPQISFDHDERLVSVFMIMPDKVAL